MATSTIPKLSVQRPLSKGRAVEEALGNAQSQVDEWAQAGTLGEQIGLVSAIPVSLAEQTIGAIQGLTEKKLRTSDDAITRAVQDARPQESIRQRVLEDAQLRTRHPVALVPKPFPPGLEKECSSMSCFMAGTLSWVPDGQTCDEYLRSRGFESVLEIELLYPAFKQASRRFALSPDANPPLELHMDVRATLRRTGESDALYSFSFAYRGAARKFTAWAAHDAQPLREELEHCYATVAAKIVEQLAVHAWTEDLPMELARTSSLDSRQPVEGK